MEITEAQMNEITDRLDRLERVAKYVDWASNTWSLGRNTLARGFAVIFHALLAWIILNIILLVIYVGFVMVIGIFGR